MIEIKERIILIKNLATEIIEKLEENCVKHETEDDEND